MNEKNMKSKIPEKQNKLLEENLRIMSKYTNQCGLTKEKEREIEHGEREFEMRTLENEDVEVEHGEREIEMRTLENENVMQREKRKSAKREKTQKENKLKMKYINIQGLTKSKIVELQKLIEQNTILFLVETQLKEDKIEVGRCFEKIDQMRNKNDKKGGGLSVLYRKDNSLEIEVEKVETKSKELLMLDISTKKDKYRVILVYFSILTSENAPRNEALQREIAGYLDNTAGEKLLILGDFNGHIDELGYQKQDRRGDMVMEWIIDYGMVLLNMDDKCQGIYTWERQEQKSVIDFVLASKEMYDEIRNMNIDDNKEVFDLSDHNMIIIEIKTVGRHSGKVSKREYLSNKEEDLQKYKENLKAFIMENEIANFESLSNEMERIAKETLKKVYIRKEHIIGEEKTQDPPWFNKSLEAEIKKRKQINRTKRSETDTTKKNELNEQYKVQKERVQMLIKIEIEKYERKITEEIKFNKNKNKLWENIKKLQGKENQRKDTYVYDERGNKISNEEERKELRDTWEKVYKKEKNEVEDFWNENKEQYGLALDRNEIQIRYRIRGPIVLGPSNDDRNELLKIPGHLREHFDMEFCIDSEINSMDKTIIGNDDIIKSVRRMKNNKSPGLDQLKIELYKEVITEKEILQEICIQFNNVILTGGVPQNWKTSKTIMIPKTKKPQAVQLRPIALTNNSYKIFMNIVREKIETHLEKHHQIKVQQNGFCPNRRLEDNLAIFKYCVEETFRMKKKLFVTAIDYTKAFDSINRKELIKTMMKYKIDYNLINIIAQIYSGDMTEVHLREDLEESFEIENGIRQGCTGSSLLFRLITYMIIETIEEQCHGFRNDKFRITCLFFADDGIIFEESETLMKRTMRIVTEVSSKYGLNLNKTKSSIMIFNNRNQTEEIDGIKITKEIKYLGIKIDNKRKMFTSQKKEMIKKAQRLANCTFSVIEKSVNKLLIGKTYWKNVALPSVLHGIPIIDMTKTDLDKIQRIENSVYRKILGGQRYAPNCTLRGEIGASLMHSRYKESKLNYYRYAVNSKNELLRGIIGDMEEKEHKWYLECKTNMQELGIMNIEDETKSSLKMKIRDQDHELWMSELNEKRSLSIYKMMKDRVKEENIYDNNFSSVLWYRARSNTLQLEDRKRFQGGDGICKLCGIETEDLIHFVLECPAYSAERCENADLQRPYIEDKQRIIGELLFENEKIPRNKIFLAKIWKIRMIKLEMNALPL